MCMDVPDLQKKPSHRGISRLILSLRTGLTMKPPEDVVMVLRNLACRLSTPSQWQLATGHGYFELLSTSLNHRSEEVRVCAFNVVMECLLNLSSQETIEDSYPSLNKLLKLVCEFLESREMNSSMACVFFQTIGSLCSSSSGLRDEVLTVVTPSTLRLIEPRNLSFDALAQFTFAIHAMATKGAEKHSLALPLSEILDDIAVTSQLPCEICGAICATLSSFMDPLQGGWTPLLCTSSRLIRRLSEHVASVHCNDSCSDAYIELIERVLQFDGADLFSFGNYSLSALHMIIYERCIASVARVCAVLAKLLSGPPNQISLVVHYNLVSPLAILLANPDAEVRDEARSGLRNFIARANFGHWYQAVKMGFVESLLIPLSSTANDIVFEAIDICFAVMISAKSAEIDCYVLQRMLNNEVDDVFRVLLFHDDKKVSSSSQKFFDKYFREEFSEEDVEQESSF